MSPMIDSIHERVKPHAQNALFFGAVHRFTIVS
jgi:hypothetical protein